MRTKVVLLLLVCLLVSFNLQAKLGMGVGFAQGQSPYRNVSSNTNTIPAYISYEGEKGYFRGIEGGLHLWSRGERGKRITLSALAAGHLEGYKASDSSYLEGMKKRSWSLDAGVGTTLEFGYNRFTAKAFTDVLGKHDGQSLDLGYAYIYPVTSKLMLIPSGNATWQSANLLDYYFGVTDEEQRAGRAAYKVGSGVQLRASLLANYTINPNTSLLVVVSTRRLPNSVSDSPLVDRDQISSIFGAINFSF